jgi:hypothetical protein
MDIDSYVIAKEIQMKLISIRICTIRYRKNNNPKRNSYMVTLRIEKNFDMSGFCKPLLQH